MTKQTKHFATRTNASNFVFVILLLVVLGCACPKLGDLAKKGSSTPQPTSSTPVTTTAPLTAKGEYDVTIEKFDRISVGMRRSEVESILGGKGTEYYNGKGGRSTFISVKWVGDNYKTIFVSYRDDKVTSKTQAGLK